MPSPRPKSSRQVSRLTPSRAVVPFSGAYAMRLPNGMELLLNEQPSLPLVSVQLWVRAGSLHEGRWLGSGLAHALEHMLFKGTARRSAKALTAAVARLGGSINAYTSWNRTVYWIDGLAENLGAYLEILADMAMHSELDEREFKREKEVILREMDMDADDPDAQLQHHMLQACFRDHPLSLPVLGRREIFTRLCSADLREFVATHYVPNQAFLSVAGAVSPEQLQAAATQHFGAWQAAGIPLLSLPAPAKPAQHAAQHHEFAAALGRLALGWQVPGEASGGKAALDVLAFLLGSGRSSRLHQRLCEGRAMAHEVWAGCYGTAQTAMFVLEAVAEPTNLEACASAMRAELSALARRGPTPADLSKAVASACAAQWKMLASTRGQASAMGSSWLACGHMLRGAQYLEQLRGLDAKAIAKAADEHLSLAAAQQISVGPGTGKRSDSTAKAPPETLGGSQARSLPNGLGLEILTDSRLDWVSLRLSMLASLPVEPSRLQGISQMTAALMLKGTKRRNAAAIAASLESRGGSLICHADAHRLNLGAEVLSADLDLAMGLIAEMLTQPLLEANQLEVVRRRQLAQIQEEAEDPVTVALRRARALVLRGTCFEPTALGSAETLQAVDRQSVCGLLAEVACARNAQLAVVGAVDVGEVERLAAKHFGRMRSGSALTPRVERPAQSSGAMARVHSLTLPKEQAVVVRAHRSVGLGHQDLAALLILEEACSDMSSRLFHRIREQLGLAYSVGAQHMTALGAGAFYFYAVTSGNQVERAGRELGRLVNDLALKGLQRGEIEQAKASWRAQWLRAKQSYGGRADTLAWAKLSGLGIERFESLAGAVERVTAAEVKSVAARYLGARQAFQVMVRPQSKKPVGKPV